jgi:ADP-ribosylglycohydrolase
MDGLAMALHMVYYTDSFKECAVKCADMGGDCDTVGSIAGQIAGAAYGIGAEMLKLYSEMEDFVSGRYEVFLVGYKLINRIPMENFLEIKAKNAL